MTLDDLLDLPEKPEGIETGYVQQIKGKLTFFPCSRDELRDQIFMDSRSEIKYVALPEHKNLIIPEADFFTYEPLLKRTLSDQKVTMIVNACFALFYIGLIAATSLFLPLSEIGRSTIFLLSGIFILNVRSLHSYFKFKKVDKTNFHKRAASAKLLKAAGIRPWKLSTILPVLLVILLLLPFETWTENQFSIKIGVNESILFLFITLFNGQILLHFMSFKKYLLLFATSAAAGAAALFLYNHQTIGLIPGGTTGFIGFSFMLLLMQIKFRKKVALDLIISSVLESTFLLLASFLILDATIDISSFAGFATGAALCFVMIKRDKEWILQKIKKLSSFKVASSDIEWN